jgi:hypothetical protein
MDLDDWVDGVHSRIIGLELGGQRINFSRESLADLAVGAFEDEVDDESGAQVAAYLGETLMRIGGGRWIEIDNRPAVLADPALDLPAVVPATLIPARTEHEFTDLYDRWAEAAAARRKIEPGWIPVKEPTPGLGDPEPEIPSATLDAWLAQREVGFPAWADHWAPKGNWDFSVGSLGLLADLLTRQVGDPKALDDPRHRDLADGAAWYLGETVRRAGGGHWAWRDEVGPYVANVGSSNRPLILMADLRNGMRMPGFLARRYRHLLS